MITQYIHDTETAECFSERLDGTLITNPFVYFNVPLRRHAHTTVKEGHEAEREFMNHFGDDSSWPAGWWGKMHTEHWM